MQVLCHFKENAYCHFIPAHHQQGDAGQTIIPKSPWRKIVSRAYKFSTN